MSNYLVKNIKTNEELIVNTNLKTISVGKVYYFLFSEDSSQGTYEVINESDKQHNKTIRTFWSGLKK